MYFILNTALAAAFHKFSLCCVFIFHNLNAFPNFPCHFFFFLLIT